MRGLLYCWFGCRSLYVTAVIGSYWRQLMGWSSMSSSVLPSVYCVCHCNDLCVCVCVSVCVCMCVWLCVYVSASECMWMWMWLCVWVSVSVCVCECVWLGLCVYVSVFMCVYVRLSYCMSEWVCDPSVVHETSQADTCLKSMTRNGCTICQVCLPHFISASDDVMD